VFEKFKKFFGGDSAQPPVPNRTSTASGGVRRPAKPRARGARSGNAEGDRPAPKNLFEPANLPAPREVLCPSCGEPMLAGWGTTCGSCRPNLVAAKTLYLAPGQVASTSQLAGEGMTLGWLVVVSSLDVKKQGALIELRQATSTLSRSSGAGGLGASPDLFEFEDIFMSTAHARVSRPKTGSRDDAFEIRDREATPTANGTFINSRRLPPGEIARLADGDVIKVGATEIVFKSLWLPGSGSAAS
jgi:FHA domain